MTSEPTPQGARLAGWKEIGDYLGKSARTVQRWEKELGFPIQRIRTSKGQIIYADRQEIDAWLARQSANGLAADETSEAVSVEPAADHIESDAVSIESPADRVDPEVAADAFGGDRPTDPSGASPRAIAGPAPRRSPWKAGLISAGAVLTLAVIAGAVWKGLGPNPGRKPTVVIAPAASPAAAALTRPDADEVYMTLTEAIAVVDATDGRVVRTIPIPRDVPFTSLGPATLSSDGRTLALPTERSDGIAMFDLVSEHFMRWYEVSDRRMARAMLSQDGKRILAVDGAGRLHILDVTTGAHIDVVVVAGGESFDGKINRRGDLFYLLNRDAGTVSVIDLTTRRVAQTIVTAIGAHDIVITPNGSRAFVTNEYAGSMSCLDADENRVIKTVTVERNPASLALDPVGRAVYVSNRDSDSISVVNPVTCEVQRTIVGAVPGSTVGAVGTNRDGSRVFVAGSSRSLLVEFDAASWQRIATIPLTFEALSIVPSPVGLASKTRAVQ